MCFSELFVVLQSKIQVFFGAWQIWNRVIWWWKFLKVKFSRSPLECYFTEVILPNNIWWLSRSPPPMSSFSKKIWVVPLWIPPKFSAIPPFGFSVATDPPFCSPKNQVIPSNILRSPPPAINNDRSPSVGDQGEIFYLLHWWHSFYYTYLHLSQMG